jgi:hypothetical protein
MSNKLNGLLCLPEPGTAFIVDQDDNQLQAAED